MQGHAFSHPHLVDADGGGGDEDLDAGGRVQVGQALGEPVLVGHAPVQRRVREPQADARFRVAGTLVVHPAHAGGVRHQDLVRELLTDPDQIVADGFNEQLLQQLTAL